MSEDFNELDKLANADFRSKWAYYETEIGCFKFNYKETKRKRHFFHIFYKSNDLIGFFNNGTMLLSDIKKLLRSHKGKLYKFE